jgi:HK97 family phage prohead protease
MEIRDIYASLEFRALEEPDGAKKIEGYFIVYEQPTELWKDFYEQVGRGSARKSIANNDIRALYNHDPKIVLGRNKSGTLKLYEDDYGVKGVIDVNETDLEASNVYARVKRGDITGASFGFRPLKEETQKKPKGGVLVTIEDMDLIEISICAFPAYPQTSVYSRQKRYLKEKTEELKERLKKCL